MNTPQLLTGWRKSSRSGNSGGNCVELAAVIRSGMESQIGK
ncbi:DUF397 domain-containing protein [Actinoallomurus sp. NPDC050550]